MRVPSQAVIVPCSYTAYTSGQPLHLLRAIAVSSVAQAQGALHSLSQCLACRGHAMRWDLAGTAGLQPDTPALHCQRTALMRTSWCSSQAGTQSPHLDMLSKELYCPVICSHGDRGLMTHSAPHRDFDCLRHGTCIHFPSIIDKLDISLLRSA